MMSQVTGDLQIQVSHELQGTLKLIIMYTFTYQMQISKSHSVD